MDAARAVDAVVVLRGQLLGRGVARVLDNRLSSSRSTGELRPPRLASGAAVPVSRWRRIQRRSVHGFNENRSATAVCSLRLLHTHAPPAPGVRMGNGFAMGTRNHRLTDNSTEFWG